jgi:hypothetical protein
MTETVASLSAQLETLNAARASGVRTVSYQANGVNRSVEYRSDREMAMAQMDLERRIAALQAGGPRRTVLIATSKGLRRHRVGLGDMGDWLTTDGVKEDFEREHRDD